ncbi:DUF86 domain-containing protein [Shewanella sp. 202IG2-18]|uniref:type VII toxin-antitoxin system HepT family RNase toxin n=1 Tax=Parashewanella hymeniacidonis TaxID=2807618 RepID=UPI00195FD632|nr:DUF86 domain-containing protein [Parashewanella hymeniacidonis]MBM7072092.1 DUF86 domain-containing protein [Parashewanella hymeniacidonis]
MNNTPNDDIGLKAYLIEANKHSQHCLHELNHLTNDLLKTGLNTRDYLAAERLLQIYTELCIGLAKHCVKKIQSVATNEAYESFQILHSNGLLTIDELNEWRKIIGMRNGLVHDYLNIDLSIIEQIIRNKKYITLSEFVNKAIKFMQTKSA